MRYGEHEVFIENNEDLDYPYICWDLDENCYSFEVDEVDEGTEEKAEMVFEVPKGYECAIEEVDGKSKVIMRKSHNVLKTSGLSYGDFELGKEYNNIDYSTYKHIKAVNALSYIRMYDKDFLLNDIRWEGDLWYIGWDNINGNIEIRKTDVIMGANDVRVGIELLNFNYEEEANKFIKRYSESIDMNELLCNYYRFDFEQ